MKKLHDNFLKKTTAGYAQYANGRIVVTEDSTFQMNDICFNGAGQILKNKTVIYDYNKEGSVFKGTDYGFTADFNVQPYDGGYSFTYHNKGAGCRYGNIYF